VKHSATRRFGGGDRVTARAERSFCRFAGRGSSRLYRMCMVVIGVHGIVRVAVDLCIYVLVPSLPCCMLAP
jgi:hypothetical protein